MYQQLLLAIHELFGRQTKAMRCVIPADQFVTGKVDGKDVTKIIIDPGSTHSLIDWACARKLGLHVNKGARFHIELANGQLEKPKGITDACHFTLSHTIVDIKFCVVDACGPYETILGLDWLKVVDAKGCFM